MKQGDVKMKGIKRKIFQATTVLALASSSILGTSMITQKPTYAITSESIAEKIMQSLTDEQRAALQNLDSTELKTGLRLSDDVDLTSEEEVTVIVEFKELPAKVAQIVEASKGESISLEKAKEKVEKSHAEFKKSLQEKIGKNERSNKDNFNIKYTYQNAFNGVTMSLPANQINKLMEMDTVKAVFSDRKVQIDPPPPITEEEQTKVDSIPFLNIDKLHEEGYTGKGIKIGVIDTGIDYNHPDLKDVYKGGHDFVDNDNDPMEATYAQWKTSGKAEIVSGKPYYTSHGTHVSGTIAGQAKNDSDYKVTGVAPDSDLYVYRVLGPYGSGQTSAVIAGIERSIADGMDVINLSLGSTQNNPLEVASLAIDNAVLSGVTAVVAAGNDGDGMYTLGSPGAAALALTVGASSASTKVTTFASTFTSNGIDAENTLQLMTKTWTDDFSNLSGQKFDIVNVGEGGATDYAGKNVQGKVAFVVRGTYALIDKMKYAKQNGAVGVIIYNNVATEGQIPFYLGESSDNIPVFSMTNNDGLHVNDLFTSGTPSVTLGALGEGEIPGDELASFSSRGPSGTLYDIKPEVTAPGVSVLSTVPSYINDKTNFSYSTAYTRMSGTSMATPHVAGIAALLLQAHPEYTPADVKTVLMNTAEPLRGQYSVFEVGAGRVDPYDAIKSTTELAVQDETPYIKNNVKELINEQTGGLSYGFVPIATEDITKTTNLLITNYSDKMEKYNISVEYNVGVRGSMDAKENGVSLLLPEDVKINKNSQESIPVALSIPPTAKKGTYEGYINLVDEKDPTHHYRIPFGFRLVEEGFEYFKVHSPNIATNRQQNPYSVKSTDLDFRLNSPMNTLDFILVDPKTNKDLGFIKSINTSGSGIDLDLYIQSAFNGRYFPFTGNAKKPIGIASILATDGLYKIKVIGTNLDGKQYTKTDQVYIDNNVPTFTLDDTNALPKGDLPFVELAPGQKTVTLSGSVYNSDAIEMEANGINVNQTKNNVWYGPYSPALGIPTDVNGKFTKEITVDPGYNQVNRLQFVGADKAGNTTNAKIIYYMKPGTQFIYAKPNKESFTMGDQLTYTFYAHGLQNAKDLTVKFDYTSKYFNSVVINKGQALSDDTVFTVISTGTTSKMNTINIKTPGEGLTGDIALFDVQVDTNANEMVNVNQQFFYVNANATSYLDLSGKKVNPYFEIGILPSYSAYSTASAKINAQGLLNANGGFNYAIDYTTIGAQAKLKDSKGQLYNGEIQKFGDIVFKNLPTSEQVYTVIIDVPGHFTTYTPMEIGRKDGDNFIGENISYSNAREHAGDINKDNVIDIYDVILLEQYWGTNNRNCDLNFDKTVDAKDFKLLEANYTKENDYVLDTPTAVKELNGTTIESIKNSLGIN